MKTQVLVKVYRELLADPTLSQRQLAARSGLSAGTVNHTIQYGTLQGQLERVDGRVLLTDSGRSFLENSRVENAIILAAGFGSRCVPLTYETPKGLLTVNGQPMLERQIEQLRAKGIEEIIIVVGYMKEAFDYLIDKFGVKLVYNPDFSTKNNFASLYWARAYLGSTYVLMADNWIEHNPFHTYEPYSWFSSLYYEGPTEEWCLKASPSGLIQKIDIGGQDSLAVVGPAYFTRSFSETFSRYLCEYYPRSEASDYYWEHILREHLTDLPMYVNEQTGNVHEFENLAELRAYDTTYIHNTQNKIMEYISKQHNVGQGKIEDIVPLKEGVTNQSFRFSIHGEAFVFRLPGKGTAKLINRANEKRVYEVVEPVGIADEIVCFDENNGIKISHYYHGAQTADPFCDEDLEISMQKVKELHDRKLHVEHSFDIAKMIEYYYSLAADVDGIRFSDIDEVRLKLKELLAYKKKLGIPEVLCHGDFAHTNVLRLPSGDTKIIDWEYSGMADPIMDVALYAIYAAFDRERIDLSLRFYLGRQPDKGEQARLYLYVALGGFLWSMWSEYKQALGQDFGEYPMAMYRYMKDYYKILKQEQYL